MMRIQYLLPVLLLPLFSSCILKKPEACFTFTINENEVLLDPSCSDNAESYEWDFGNGRNSTTANPSHRYFESGTYTITLTVLNGSRSSTFSQDVTVEVDPCRNVSCDQGECVNGICVCEPGFTGPTCSTPANEKFIGQYLVSESCNPSGAASYAVTLTPVSGSLDRFNVTGLWAEAQFTCQAIITNSGNTITIARTNIYTITSVPRQIASLNISSNEDGSLISIDYAVYNGSSSTVVDQCAANLSRI